MRPLHALVATGLRARSLAQPLRFAMREIGGSHAVRPYRLRGTDVWLYLQHKTPDVLVLDEVFYQRLYELPPELEHLRGRPLRALDGGGNIGLFGAWLLASQPGSEVVSVEPDERNASVLARTIERNEGRHRWRLVKAALATAPGTVSFAGGEFAVSKVVDDAGASTVEAVDFFAHTAEAELVKLDIEGSEWAILADPRLRELRAEAIVLEYHPDNCPRDDPHAAVAALLGQAGFQTKPIFTGPNGVGMLWAWPTAS